MMHVEVSMLKCKCIKMINESLKRIKNAKDIIHGGGATSHVLWGPFSIICAQW